MKIAELVRTEARGRRHRKLSGNRAEARPNSAGRSRLWAMVYYGASNHSAELRICLSLALLNES